MRWKIYIPLLLLILVSPSVLSQNNAPKDDKKKKLKIRITAGPQVGLTLPTDFGANQSVQRGDTIFNFIPQPRFRLGACVRIDFSKRFSLQTGLYYISRRYGVEIGKTNGQGTEIETMLLTQGINYIGYELPIMGLLYVQLGERWFLNNALGISLDFFPSSSQVIEEGAEYEIFNGRNSWIIPSVRVNIGFEYRSDKAGSFWLGGSFHRPLVKMSEIFVERSNSIGIGLQTVSQQLSGTYFSIDFKYFFPTGKKSPFMQ